MINLWQSLSQLGENLSQLSENFRTSSVVDWALWVLAIMQCVKIIHRSRHPLLIAMRARIEVSNQTWLQELIECPWCLSLNVAPCVLLLWAVSKQPEMYGAVSGLAALAVYTLAITQVVNLLYQRAWHFERQSGRKGRSNDGSGKTSEAVRSPHSS